MSNNKGLFSSVVHGIKWTGISSILGIIMQLVYTSVMAHLLEKEDFGVLTLAMVVTDFGRRFTRLGIGEAIVQKETLNNNDIRAAFTSSLFLGLLIYLIIYISTPWVALFYQSESLPPVIRVIGLTLVFSGFTSTSMNLLRRQMRFKESAIVNLVSFFLAYIVVGITMAYMDFGIWSLVAANMLLIVISGTLYFLLVRHTVIPTFVWQHYVALLSYGSKMTVNTVLEYFSINLSKIMIGRFLSDAKVGIYSQAEKLINLPLSRLNESLNKVIFPGLSKLQNDKVKLKQAYMMSIMLISLMVFPVALGVSAAAKEIVFVVLGAKWEESVVILQVVSIAVSFRFVMMYSGMICDTTARLNEKMVVSIVTLVIDVILLSIFGSLFGLVGFAFGMLIGEIIRTIIYGYLLNKIIQVTIKDYIAIYLPAIFYGMVVGLSILGVKHLCSLLTDLDWVILIAEIATGGISLGAVLLLVPHKMVKTHMAMFLSKLGLSDLKNPILRKILFNYLK